MPSRSENRPLTSYYSHYQTSQSAPLTDGTYYFTKVVDLTCSVAFGPNVIGWREKMKAGIGVNTEMIGQKYKNRTSYGSITFHNTSSPGSYVYISCSGRVGAYTYVLPVKAGSTVVAEAKALAEQRFTKNYRKKTRQFQSGVFAGEILQTARLLASPGKALFKGVLNIGRDLNRTVTKAKAINGFGKVDVSRLTKRQVKNINESVSSQWLEWSFGMKPTMNDIDDAARAFRQLSQGRGFDLVRVKGDGRGLSELPSSLVSLVVPKAIPNSNQNKLYRSGYDVCDATIRAAWRNENPSGEMPVPSIMGTTLLDFVPTVWELLPYSWLIDYFTSVGDTLDAWQMRYVNFAWTTSTTRSRQVIRYSDIISRASTATIKYGATGGHAVLQRSDVERKVLNGANFDSGFTLKLPGMGTKWLNLGALASLKASRR